MLQSTLGNLPEFFVVIFALSAGKTVVAQTAIVGSVLANALFVLGLAIVAGAWVAKDNVMRFSTRLPNDAATLLLLAIVHHRPRRASRSQTHNGAARHLTAVSTVASVCLLVVYAAWVVPYLRRGLGARGEPERARTARDLRPPSSCCSSPARRPRSSPTGSSPR